METEPEPLMTFCCTTPYPTVSSHIKKSYLDTDLDTKTPFQKGKMQSFMSILKRHLKFFKMFALQLGFLGKFTGFLLAKNSGFGVIFKYLKINEAWMKNHGK
jgi:hypothetical protein